MSQSVKKGLIRARLANAGFESGRNGWAREIAQSKTESGD